ncbi:hypothetical protein [Ammoniphilus sp. 3BR4]|uniref:hypothetical protein n=1 Tax=Ammoniphilus sp. 3BR4 TaxID=3158265 RepID=UPI003465DCEE
MSFVHFDEILELCCEEIVGGEKGLPETKQSYQGETKRGARNGQIQPAIGKRKRMIVSTRPQSKPLTFTR